MLWVAVSTAHAVGFGRISNTTNLGQPLNFEAIVRLSADEVLNSECVSAEVFSGDNKLVQPLVRVQLDAGADPNERRVRVRTTTAIDEPVVTVVLTLGCDSKTSRRFVAFVDPPNVALAQGGTVGESPSSAMAPDASAAVATARPGGDASGSPDVRSQPTARQGSGSAGSASRRSSNVSTATQAKRAKPAQLRSARAPAQAGPRLRLEAAPALLTAKPTRPKEPAVAAVTPAPSPAVAATPVAASAPVASAAASAAASSVVVAAAASGAVDPMSQLLGLERARLQALEESLTRVRAETQSAQKALVTLQSRVVEAESQRYQNPLVYALSGVCALLALAVAALWRRQARARTEAKWWGTAAPTVAPVHEEPPPSDNVESQFADVPEVPTPAAKLVAPAEGAGKPTWVDSRQTEPSPDLLPEPRRDLSVEELIDLEQQAEFFVVLGQDDAAIDLLMGHVRSTGGISPLPYLKLLEIYRRRGDRSAYERIRERFNRRFNAYAPDWDADLQQGRSLEDYPATIARLEALWVMPSRVMETLEASLFRRDETEEAFDLPAYRELLFLYAVARDFAHKADDSSAVDLLLPMETDTPNAPVSRLVASMPSMLSRQNSSAPVAGTTGGEQAAHSHSESAGHLGDPNPDSGFSLDIGGLDLVDDPTKPGGTSRR
jgi:pilus assembly protein FimV